MSWLRPILVLALLLPIGSSLHATATDPPLDDGCPDRRIVIIEERTGPCANGARRWWQECRDNAMWYCYQICENGVWKASDCIAMDNNAGGGYLMENPNKIATATCDYDCPPDLANQVIYGRRKTTSFECVDGKVTNKVSEVGQCGDPRCVRRIKVECKPGQPCPPCPPGRTGGVCDYCTPGDTRDCRGVTQICGPDGVFPPCFPPCVPSSKVFCPCTGEWLECDPVTGLYPTCKPGCIPGQTIYCPSGQQRTCKADCTHDPCDRCPSGGCRPPDCTEDCCLGEPECVERPGEWVCSWAGREIVRVPPLPAGGARTLAARHGRRPA